MIKKWFICFCFGILPVIRIVAGNKDMKLHYNRPAEFFEEAMVIGNGRLGAIVYGGPTQERIS